MDGRSARRPEQGALFQVVAQHLAGFLSRVGEDGEHLDLIGLPTTPYKRIGELVRMTENAVRMRYRRAIQWMKQRLPDLLAGDSEFSAGRGGTRGDE